MAAEDIINTLLVSSDADSVSTDLCETTDSSSESDSGSERSVILKQMLLLEKLLHKNKRHCIRNYLEEIVPRYCEEEFVRHFRVSKNVFKYLCEELQTFESFSNLRADKKCSSEKHIAVFLWFAGHEACCYRNLADRFDLSLSSVSRIIERTIKFICSLGPKVIKWPNEVEKRESSLFLKNKTGFPNVIGAIDGTHIVIDPPESRKDDYVDRKGDISLKLQGICNDKKKFISVFVGYPGSSHDSWVFSNSFIYPKLRCLCGDYYILGDSAYPLKEYLLTPYRDNGHLTRAQKIFNMKLSSCRVIIEHTFGILKQRFRQLYYCKLRGIPKLCNFIVACCILHNLCNENDLDFTNTEIENPIEMENEDNVIRGNNIAKELRDRICNEFHSI